jgi:hypothetical protein
MLEFCQAYGRYLPTDTTSLRLAHAEDNDSVFGDSLWRNSANPKNGVGRRLIVLLGAAYGATVHNILGSNGSARRTESQVGTVRGRYLQKRSRPE